MQNDPFNNEDFLYFDSYVTFNLSLFIKVLLYLAIYKFILGPFFCVFVRLYEGRNFAINVGIWGWTKEHLEQYIHFFCMCVSFSILAFADLGFNLNFIDLLMAFEVSIFMNVIKAFRIATSSASN